MKWNTWMSAAAVLKVAALAALPLGSASAADGHEFIRAALDQSARVAFAPDLFGRKAVSANFHTKSMSGGDARHGRGKAGKHRK